MCEDGMEGRNRFDVLDFVVRTYTHTHTHRIVMHAIPPCALGMVDFAHAYPPTIADSKASCWEKAHLWRGQTNGGLCSGPLGVDP